MYWRYNPFMIPLITAAVISIVVALFAWRRRPAPGSTSFILLILSVAEWSLGYALELGSVDLATKGFWSQVKYIGIVMLPVAWLFFALQYIGRSQWLKFRHMALIAIEPAITLILVWTNDLHGLIWSSIGMDSLGSFSVRVSTYGIWFWIHALYSYLLLFLGAILLLKTVIRSPDLYRDQVVAVLIGVLAPWVGNGLYIFRLGPSPNLDLTPFAFTFTGIAFAWSFFGFRLLDIVPVAHETIIENMRDIVIVLDVRNRIVVFNQAAQCVIGYTAAEAIGQPVTKILSNWPDLVERYSSVTEKSLEIVLDADKKQRHFDMNLLPLHDKHSRLNGRLILLHNITERKEAEDVLQKAHDELERRVAERTAELVTANDQLKQEIRERQRTEEALHQSLALVGRAKREWESTVDSLPQLIFVLDDRGCILRTNRTVEKWQLGKVTDVKGHRIHELVHPNCTDSNCYLETFWPQACEELAHGRSSQWEVEDRMINRHFRVQLRPISPKPYRRGEKTESFAVVVLYDITERKRSEEALKESKGYLKTLLDSIHAGIIVIKAETHKIIDANSFALEMFGANKEQVLGMECHSFVCPAEKGKCPITDLQQTVDISERVLLKKSGEQISILKSVVPIIRKGREYLIESFIDITKHIQIEREKTALEEQLLQSQKMEAIGRLAGGVAHDFNNLLTPITGYSQLVINKLSSSDPLRNDLQEIQRAAERASTLTRQLLVFSRSQSLKPQVVNFNNIMLDIGNMLRRLIGEQIELVMLPGSNLGSVKVDPNQFEQVIVNLTVNARDAMPNGGKLLLETTNVILNQDYIYRHTGIPPGEYILFAVSDTGIGMTDEVKAHLFEPFFTTKETGKGTGLGLSMVFGIVKQSNGHILVYSELDQGTTFKIYLPRVEVEMVTIPQRNDLDYMPRGDETILLVEDEPLVRGLALRILREQGYIVLEASNGNEALNVAQKRTGKRIHLLLTDLVMPQMGGKELATQFKNLRPEIKVLFTSGYTDNAIVHHGVLEPGTHFLQKPFSPKSLSQKVRGVLDT